MHTQLSDSVYKNLNTHNAKLIEITMAGMSEPLVSHDPSEKSLKSQFTAQETFPITH